MLTVGERDGGRRRNSVTMEPTRRRLSVYESATTARRNRSLVLLIVQILATVQGGLSVWHIGCMACPSTNLRRMLQLFVTSIPTNLHPTMTKGFAANQCKISLKVPLRGILKNCIYSPAKCSRLTASIAEEIKDNVKLLGFERYKIVCCAQIGSLNDQAIRSASRCLWDTSSDCAASGSFSNESLFACVTVFGVYGE